MTLFTVNGRPSYSRAEGRWMGIGPYYAMFPLKFAFEVVEQYSKEGEAVLDPFAGRASSTYAAAASGRTGIGIEINPVGWLYGRAKLSPPNIKLVLRRLDYLYDLACTLPNSDLDQQSDFFRYCFAPDVLKFLKTCRNVLKWRTSIVDATLMALLLVYLHGNKGQALSNQMRQTKAMHPHYSVKWWKERQMLPPDINPGDFLKQRIEWRYEKGAIRYEDSKVILGDSTKVLKANRHQTLRKTQFSLLFTSPPYYGLTNYFYDQWLRLWMLGGDDAPTFANKEQWQKKFESKVAYYDLLKSVFGASKRFMCDKAVIYVRTDARQFTFDTTLKVLTEIFPKKSVNITDQPFLKQTQTALYGDKSLKPGEIDIVLLP